MKSKLSSRKFWVCLWAMAVLTYAIFIKLDVSWFGAVAPMLVGVIGVYVGANAYLKGKGNGE